MTNRNHKSDAAPLAADASAGLHDVDARYISRATDGFHYSERDDFSFVGDLLELVRASAETAKRRVILEEHPIDARAYTRDLIRYGLDVDAANDGIRAMVKAEMASDAQAGIPY